jgi:hypothetical protein
MERHQIRRYIGRGIGIAIGVVVAAAGPGANAAPAVAQGHAGSPAARTLARVDRGAGILEGKLTRVDGRTETVDVSIGPLSLLGKTLEVRSDTLIQVDGREARFADLQEGAKVKAFYEERGAKLVATRIEVTS